MKNKISTLFFQCTAGVIFSSFALYSYLTKQNECTELNMRLPKISKEIETLNQENAFLRYQMISFESPDHLLQLAQAPEYAHLKFPFTQDVLTVKEGIAVEWHTPDEPADVARPAKTVVIGTNL